MTESIHAPLRSPAQGQPHPSPHRARVGAWSMWFAILGAPLAWTLQLLINSSVASMACFPHDVPLAQPAWPPLASAASAVEIVALLVCVAAGLTGWRNWRLSRAEAEGGGQRVVGSGDGRTRFMAMVGMLCSGLFLIATGVAFAFVLTVPPCAG